MKSSFPILLIVSLLAVTQVGRAQTSETPHMIGGKVLFVDYGYANSIDTLDITNGLEVFYTRRINEYLNFSLPFKLGVANFPGDINNKNFLSIDALLHFKFAGDKNRVLVPYFLGGGSVVVEEFEDSNVQLPLGGGMNIRIGVGSYINLQGEYRFSVAEERNNIQAGIGYVYQIGRKQLDTDDDGIPDVEDQCPGKPGSEDMAGCPDTDGDGLADIMDACPEEAGLQELDGCPDTDGDGLADHSDRCPDEAGTTETGGCPDDDEDGFANADDDCPEEPGELNGCPDDDNDGISNAEDGCPYEAGPSSNNGCPVQDSDNDGIPDAQDECPDQAGNAAANGCPDLDGDGVPDRADNCPSIAGEFNGCPDSDGDGIDDSADRCPNEVGTVTNSGCPEIEEEDKETLVTAMQAVQFETGKATLKAESYEILDKIVDILRRYPSYQLDISGHTDNVGNPANNKELSEDRAKSCYEYIISKGIGEDRVNYYGYGETLPIADNSTREGRRLNRRVEFDLYVE